jgi:uncharacterized coiled-coil DUF342 family protein
LSAKIREEIERELATRRNELADAVRQNESLRKANEDLHTQIVNALRKETREANESFDEINQKLRQLRASIKAA